VHKGCSVHYRYRHHIFDSTRRRRVLLTMSHGFPSGGHVPRDICYVSCHEYAYCAVVTSAEATSFFALALYETKRDHGKSAGRMIDAATPPPSSFFPQFSRVDISHSLGLVVDRGKLHLDSRCVCIHD
jgi:hypothetical protein